MSYHTTNFHTDAKTPVEHNQWFDAKGQPVKVINLGDCMNGASLFLVPESAAALHKALEQLYPELAAASEPPTEVVIQNHTTPDYQFPPPSDRVPLEVVMHYADSHAHEVAPTADEEIAAMVAELADSPNARKFGSTGSTNPALPCDGRRCCFVGRACEQTDNGRFSCTLPPGHTGPHSACGSDDPNKMSGHNLHVWANESATTNAT